MKQLLFFSIAFIFCLPSSKAQLKADAGRDTVWCSPGGTSGQLIGGANVAYGGTPPYTYQWASYDSLGHALYLLDTTSLPHPRIKGPLPLIHLAYFVLSVTDATSANAFDTVKVFFSSWICTLAGCIVEKRPADTGLLFGNCQSNFLPLRYSWSPGAYLSDSTAGGPKCWSPIPQIYTMNATDAKGCVRGSGYCQIRIKQTSVEAVANEPAKAIVSRIPDGSGISLICGMAWYGGTLKVFSATGSLVAAQKVTSEHTIIKWPESYNGMYFYTLTSGIGDTRHGRL